MSSFLVVLICACLALLHPRACTHSWMNLVFQRGVDSGHQPGKHSLVDCLREGVSGVAGLLHCQGRQDLVSLGLDGAMGQPYPQLLLRNLHQLPERKREEYTITPTVSGSLALVWKTIRCLSENTALLAQGFQNDKEIVQHTLIEHCLCVWCIPWPQ